MNRVGIVGYANTPFTKEEQKIESILHNSANHLFKNNSEIDKKLIDSVLVSTNNNSKYLSAILSEMVGIQPKIAHSIESLCNSGRNKFDCFCIFVYFIRISRDGSCCYRCRKS